MLERKRFNTLNHIKKIGIHVTKLLLSVMVQRKLYILSLPKTLGPIKLLMSACNSQSRPPYLLGLRQTHNTSLQERLQYEFQFSPVEL